MKQNWFWLTLVFWMVFTVSVISWALIFSPTHYDPQTISKYRTEINGLNQDSEIWRNEGHLKDLLPIITRSWEKEGWKQTRQSSDLSLALLGLTDEPSELTSRVQISVFQKKGFYKTLGLWEPVGKDQTYGWVSEIPDAAFNSKVAREKWSLPLLPPSEAEDLYCQKIKNFKIGIFSMPARQNFEKLCADQGFQQKLWRREQGQEIYFIAKGMSRLLAVLDSDGTRKTVSLSSFEH